ncbi:MAG: SCO family protein [Saprospiraceae bacterium]|nr:SCO family protein [Pyrinomonadaceae bacterium]
MMKSGSAKLALSQLKLSVWVFVLLSTLTISAQKSEHYNSPLYSPKTYDPSQTSSSGLPDALQKIGIEQKLGESLPLETEFKDENGQTVKLGQLFNKQKPVILAFVYYECPMLCNEVLNGLTGTLKGISFDAGKDYDVIAISFDTRENEKPGLSANKKTSYMERYGRPGTEKGWHFLTGTQESIDAVTKAAGFGYQWDEKSEQFAHAGGIMILTPDGKLSRYLNGIDYAPKDVKFGLMESSQNKVGSATEKLLLYCYHYDPSTGKYGLAILSVLRLISIVMLFGIGVVGLVFWRRNRKISDSKFQIPNSPV